MPDNEPRYSGSIDAQYTEDGQTEPDAEIHVVYRRMRKDNVVKIEGVLSGLFALRNES